MTARKMFVYLAPEILNNYKDKQFWKISWDDVSMHFKLKKSREKSLETWNKQKSVMRNFFFFGGEKTKGE